jgi:hypothetical protein
MQLDRRHPSRSGARFVAGRSSSSSSFAFQPEDETSTVPDFDIVILNDPLCEMDRVTIVPTNEFFKLDAVAVFRDLAEAILFHTHNLNELRGTRNIVFRLTRSGILCPPGPKKRKPARQDRHDN